MSYLPLKNLELFEDNFCNILRFSYLNSLVSDILLELEVDFIGINNVKSQLKSLINYLFIKSITTSENKSDLTLHMAFAGNVGMGKTSIALKISDILRDLNYLTKGHITNVTREDFVGQYIGHTAPKTKELLQKAHGGILFIDDAYQLYKANDQKDYGAEAIEIILQVMENQRDNLILIFSDNEKKLNSFFDINPGISSRIGYHLYFENYNSSDLIEISKQIAKFEYQYSFEPEALISLNKIIDFLILKENFSNIRTIQLLIHQLILYQTERVYNNIYNSKNFNFSALFTITNDDVLKLKNYQMFNIIL